MNKNEYNGWTNRETRLANLWFDDFTTEAQDCDTVEELAERIESIVTECYEEQISSIPSSSFAADLLCDPLSEVNWMEIAEHYSEDLKTAEVEEEEEENA